MFRLSKSFRFEAAHQLNGHDGKCARLHGHSWTLTVEVEGSTLIDHGPKFGMLMDYDHISRVVEPVVEDFLDHHFLNETLGIYVPTSESIASWAYYKIKPSLPQLSAITISETCTTACRYEERM